MIAIGQLSLRLESANCKVKNQDGWFSAPTLIGFSLFSQIAVTKSSAPRYAKALLSTTSYRRFRNCRRDGRMNRKRGLTGYDAAAIRRFSVTL